MPRMSKETRVWVNKKVPKIDTFFSVSTKRLPQDKSESPRKVLANQNVASSSTSTLKRAIVNSQDLVPVIPKKGNYNQETEESTRCLTASEIDKIVERNSYAIDKGTFKCPLCPHKCKPDSKQKLPKKKSDFKRHLTRKHLAEFTIFCEICEKGFYQKSDLNQHMTRTHGEKKYECKLCDYKSTNETNFEKHVESVHTKSLPFACLMPGCSKKFSREEHATEHLLHHCCTPDWLFCQTCKIRVHAYQLWNTHWNSESHQKNCELLKLRGIAPCEKPNKNLSEELKKARENPVGYKEQNCSNKIVGSSSFQTCEVKGSLKNVELFKGYTSPSGSQIKGTMWCSEQGFEPLNHCKATFVHNLIAGPQEYINIPVTEKGLFGPTTTTYRIPIASSSNCLTKCFNYVLTCAVHTATLGIRGVGMSLEQTVRIRIQEYVTSIKTLKEARENEEKSNGSPLSDLEIVAVDMGCLTQLVKEEQAEKEKKLGRKLTKDEFDNLDCRSNFTKIRHFASADCCVENLQFSVIAKYPEEENEEDDRKGTGRFACLRGEAYYQYAIKSCDESTGGLDELKEYDNFKNKSPQLTALKVSRGQKSNK